MSDKGSISGTVTARKMRPHSLQNQLLLGILLCMGVLLLGGGVVVYRMIGNHLRSEADALLEDRLNFYRATLRLKANGLPAFTMAPAEWARVSATANPDLVQIWVAESGKEIPLRSPALTGRSLPRPECPGDAPVFLNHSLWDGRSARLISQVVSPPRDDPAMEPVRIQLVVGRDLVEFDRTLARVRGLLLKTGAGLIGAMLLAARFIIRRSVRPVNALAEQIGSMAIDDSSRRFGLPGAPDELQPVVGRLNALMDRVGAAIEHERQFASHAAHELRNPLAAIRCSVEVALSRTRRPEEYEATLESIWQSQQGMQRMVDNLLLLARLESGHQRTEFPVETVSLGRLLRRSWRDCVDQAEEKQLRVAWQVDESGGDTIMVPSLFGNLVRNLFENAVNYTPAGGQIGIEAKVSGGQCLFCVTNTNPGLTGGQVAESFSPFWRADPNASGHRGNAGIGLALCRRIAETLGGRIRGSLTPEGLVSYCLEVPVMLPPPGTEAPATRRFRESHSVAQEA